MKTWNVAGRLRPAETGAGWRGVGSGASHAVLLWAMALAGPVGLAGDAAAQSAGTAGETQSAGAQGGEAPVVLDTLMVGGTPQARYDSRRTDVGGRLSSDITEIPRTIDVVPEQLLQDQHAREMEEVYRLL